jgi:hypothetical protein
MVKTAAPAPDALAAVEHRPSARRDENRGGDRGERQRDQPEDEREEDVERAQLDVHAALR